MHIIKNVAKRQRRIIYYCSFIILSPHGIAMPKGLYFTAVVFSLFVYLFIYFFFLLFRRLISKVTEQSSTRLGHVIFTYDGYLKKLVQTPPGNLPPTGWRAKIPAFWTDFETDRTYLGNETWHQQLERNFSIYGDSPTCFRNLVNFGTETAENGWRVFDNPLNFRIGRHCQTYHMDVI